MSIRYPAPLRPGDRIAVTSPSCGVGRELWPRLDFCVKHLRGLGYDVVVGDCMDGSGLTSENAPLRILGRVRVARRSSATSRPVRSLDVE